MLIRNDDILLLDEPTNHLDVHAIEWLEGFIKNRTKPFCLRPTIKHLPTKRR